MSIRLSNKDSLSVLCLSVMIETELLRVKLCSLNIHMVKFQPLVPQNVDTVENRAVARKSGCYTCNKLRSYWSRMSPLSSVTGNLIKIGNVKRQTYPEGHHVHIKAEIGVKLL